MVTREALLDRLVALPRALASAEHEALTAQRRLHAAREDLADREATILFAGTAQGSNAEARAAHLRLLTTAQRQAVQEAQEEAQLAAVRLRVVQAEFSGLRSAARLIGWPEEEEE